MWCHFIIFILSCYMFLSSLWSQVYTNKSQGRLSGGSHPHQLVQVSLVISTHIDTCTELQTGRLDGAGGAGVKRNRGY